MRSLICVGVALLMVASGANAEYVTYCDTVSFTSDLEPCQDIALDTFNTDVFGVGNLTGVSLMFYHSGKADISADNDDPLQAAAANARIIRTFTADSIPGWAFPVVGTNTEASPSVDLAADNGDLTIWDPTPPDGHVFAELAYTNMPASLINPTPISLYETAGTGKIYIEVCPTVMVNDLQWDVTPDAWQMEVEDPTFEIEVCVTYEYIPEPATLSLLALGGLALVRRRSR